MNIQERDQLTKFLQQLTQAQLAQKDREAEALIHDACIRQPDAAYLLVQRAMILDQAMQNSQTQISRLQGELDQMRSQIRAGNGSGGFLDANAWGSSPASRPGSSSPTPVNPAAQVPVAAQVAAPAASAWGSGMLGNIATTAAGVVAGGFLFQGIGHLLASHGSNPAPMSGLSSNVPSDHSDAAAITQTVDDGDASAGLFDTSAVDSFNAGDTDSSI